MLKLKSIINNIKENIHQENSYNSNLKRYSEIIKREIFKFKKITPYKLVRKQDLIVLYSTYAKYKRLNVELLHKIWDTLMESSFRCYVLSIIYYGTDETLDIDDFYEKHYENSHNFCISLFKGNTKQMEKAHEIIDNFIDNDFLNGNEIDIVWLYPEFLGNLLKNACDKSKNDDELFFNMDKLINLVHGNGDFANSVIEGGTNTLNHIRDMEMKGISLPPNSF